MCSKRLLRVQDYAAANWDHHIRMLVESSAPILEHPVKGVGYQMELASVVAEFVKFHTRTLGDTSKAVNSQQRARYLSPFTSRSSPSLPLAFGERSLSLSSWTSLRSPSPSSWDSLRSPSPGSWASARFRSPTPLEGADTPASHRSVPTSRSASPSEQQENKPATSCDVFQNKQFYPQLLEIWTHICRHEELYYKPISWSVFLISGML